MPAGRPPKFDTPEQLQQLIDEYFETGAPLREKWSNGVKYHVKVPTLSGMCLFCGFTNRASFYDYEEKSEFTNTIKEARDRITAHYEELAQLGVGAGAIFMLKNLGFTDKQEIDLNAKVQEMPMITRDDGTPVEFDIGSGEEGNNEPS